MLCDIRTSSSHPYAPQAECAPRLDNKYERDMKEDMKTAIDLLFKFKEGLDKLHPECVNLIQKMLNNSSRY
jgi:hypothetical protein